MPTIKSYIFFKRKRNGKNYSSEEIAFKESKFHDRLSSPLRTSSLTTKKNGRERVMSFSTSYVSTSEDYLFTVTFSEVTNPCMNENFL